MLSRLLLSGSFPRIAGHYVLPQTHEGIEIVYYIKGRGITTIDGRAFAFDSGYVAVIPPNLYFVRFPPIIRIFQNYRAR